MTKEEIKLECLRLAQGRGAPDLTEEAAKLFQFVLSDEPLKSGEMQACDSGFRDG